MITTCKSEKCKFSRVAQPSILLCLWLWTGQPRLHCAQQCKSGSPVNNHPVKECDSWDHQNAVLEHQTKSNKCRTNTKTGRSRE
jgi:hypothetical protein